MAHIQGETIGQQTEKTYKQAVTGNAVTALQLGSGKGKLPISQLAPSARSSSGVSNITWEELRDAINSGREFVIATDWGHATFHVHNDLLVTGHPDVCRLVAVVGDKILMYKCSSSNDGETVTWSNLIVTDIGEAPLDITYGVTSWDVLKAAYDYGRSIRLNATEFGLQVTSYFAPVFGQHDTGSDPSPDIVVFSNVYTNPNGNDQYAANVLVVKKGSGDDADEWSLTAKRIDYNDVDVVSVSSSSWTGLQTHTMSVGNRGKVVNFGTIPASVTGLAIKIPSGVNSAYFKWTLPADTTFANLSVTDASGNELKIINESKPTEFAAGDTIIASVMCGDVAYGVSKAEV